METPWPNGYIFQYSPHFVTFQTDSDIDTFLLAIPRNVTEVLQRPGYQSPNVNPDAFRIIGMGIIIFQKVCASFRLDGFIFLIYFIRSNCHSKRLVRLHPCLIIRTPVPTILHSMPVIGQCIGLSVPIKG